MLYQFIILTTNRSCHSYIESNTHFIGSFQSHAYWLITHSNSITKISQFTLRRPGYFIVRRPGTDDEKNSSFLEHCTNSPMHPYFSVFCADVCFYFLKSRQAFSKKPQLQTLNFQHLNSDWRNFALKVN